MRVTKTIKEYITKRVKVKFPMAEEEKAVRQKIEEIDDRVEQINKKIKEYALDLCETANKDLQIYHWDVLDKIHINNGNFYANSGWNSPYQQKLNTLRSERENKVNEKVKDIIVTLELGGTKADLDKMLAEVGE